MEEFIKSHDKFDEESLKGGLFSLLNKLETENAQNLYKASKELHEILLNTKFYWLISANLSLMGLLTYKICPENYQTAMNMLEDAKFLAENAKDSLAVKINCFCKGNVLVKEKYYSEALINLNEAKSLNVDFPDSSIEKLFEEIETSSDAQCSSQKPLVALLNVARTLAAETTLDLLLKTVAQEVKKVLNADRCSVFLLDKDKNELCSKVAMGVDNDELRFDADKGLAGYVVKTGEIVNIPDAYSDSRFNREIDLRTGYKTSTILCMPIRNMKHEIIGVFQVLNKYNGTFTKEDEELLVAIGASAGIAIENSKLFESQQKMIETQKELFKSFTDTLSASIDARDKITAGHSSRVKMYSGLICDALNMKAAAKNNILDAATLHDIGKIGIRDSVLQKDGKLTDEEYQHIQEHVKITYDILTKIYPSEEFKEVTEIASSHHEKYDGSGYFRKLAGEEIHIGGRILAVSDVFDAITSKRHYRDKMPVKDALNIIKNGSGKHFDPGVVDAFFSLKLDKLVNVFLSEVDWTMKEEDREQLSNYTVDCLHNLLTSKEAENFDEIEIKFFEMFNYYYNCKAGN